MVYERLKALINCLTAKDKSNIKNSLKVDTYYQKLFDEIQTKSLEELYAKYKSPIKKLNDDADYLENKILEYMSVNPKNEIAKQALKLNEILFLVDNEIFDLAEQKTKKLIKEIVGKDRYSWILVSLLQTFFTNPALFEKVETKNLIYLFCQRFTSGFNNLAYLETDAPNDFIRFIESFKEISTEVKSEYFELQRELDTIIDDMQLVNFPRKAHLLLKKAALIQNHKSSLFDNLEDAEVEITKINTELYQLAANNCAPYGQYSMTSWYAQALLSEMNLIYKINTIQIKDTDYYLNINESIINDLTLRIEVNRLIMKVFVYESISDRGSVNAEKLRGEFINLFKFIDEETELDVCLKTLYILFTKKHHIIINSTFNKYKNQIGAFDDKFYMELLNKNPKSENVETTTLKNIVYEYYLKRVL